VWNRASDAPDQSQTAAKPSFACLNAQGIGLANQIPDNALTAIEQAVRRYPNGASAQEILRILPAASPSAHAPNRLS
jgi:hypothetical protein